jgi:hypothetical protein
MHGVGGMDIVFLVPSFGYRSLGRTGVAGGAMIGVSYGGRLALRQADEGWELVDAAHFEWWKDWMDGG